MVKSHIQQEKRVKRCPECDKIIEKEDDKMMYFSKDKNVCFKCGQQEKSKIQNAIKLAKKEIKEWQKFLKLAEKKMKQLRQ